MRTHKDVVMEAVVVGIATVLMGLLVSALIGGRLKPELPQ